MDHPDHSKNKVRSSPLYWTLLVLLLGWLFAFWMPFIIVTENGLHWLNYVLYWGAAWVWLVPFFVWFRRRTYLSRLRRLRVFVPLVLLSGILVSGGWAISGRGILLPDPNYYRACDVGRHRYYVCYLPAVDIPGGKDASLTPESDPGMMRFYFGTRIEAQGYPGFALARVLTFQTRVFRASELMETW